MDILSFARKMGFSITLLSNISLLDEEKISLLKDIRISNISCTLFSLNNKVHDTITQTPGSFEALMKNMSLIHNYKLPLEVKTIVTKLNFTELLPISEFCSSHGFKYKVDPAIFARLDGDLTSKVLALDEDELDGVISIVDEIVGYERREDSDNSYICKETRCSISINAKGEITPCIRLPIVIGNIFEDSIFEVWDRTKRFISVMDMKLADFPQCRNCEIRNFCVPCPGNALVEDGCARSCSSLSRKIASSRTRVYSKKFN
jgi:radical SAM protein with 4Fe4S-binding SPASM domain